MRRLQRGLGKAGIVLALVLGVGAPALAGPSSVSTKTYKELTEIQEVMAAGDTRGAVTRLETLLGEVEADSLDQALTLQTLGYVEMSREDFPKAIDYLKRALGTERLPQNVVYNVGYMVAQLHAALGQFDEALSFAEDWFKQLEAPKPDQYMFMANIYAQVKRYAESAPYAEKAVAATDKPREAWYQLLTADYFELKKYPEATRTLQRMVKLWPDKGAYWEQLASVYMVQDDRNHALATLKIAFDLNVLEKESTVKSLIQLCVMRGIPEHGGRLLQAAMEQELLPRDETYMEMLAQAWVEARERERAVAAYSEIGETFNSGEAWMKVANIHVDATQWAQAEAAVAKALRAQLDDDDKGKAYLLLGIAKVEQGEFKSGKDALRKARTFKKTERSAGNWMNYADEMKRQSDWLAANR
ncbi:tetratricopeptide repeat protein [Mangrovimicrobium sediminis]|uniref:Tetratricopeptide repeat protein n=1 Tax=Mangrovimicrobium sediminis TaxID=2562682 RepID=A0A4Z0M5B2_9GAMM|nr:tetratricopeptide repeat protein [Haliea sp. SAOS-164]TGD74600.1 tetratricopeptide repeat protein [Haliea sp. SAOS-164]